MTGSAFSEPAFRHHPGVNTRPSGGQLQEIVDAANRASGIDDVAVQRAWQFGLFLMQRRYFWEAHEAMEPVWMRAVPNSRERHLTQGLIQLANACLKHDMGRHSAAQRLVGLSAQHIRDAASGPDDVVLGVSLKACVALVSDVREFVNDLEDGGSALENILRKHAL